MAGNQEMVAEGSSYRGRHRQRPQDKEHGGLKEQSIGFEEAGDRAEEQGWAVGSTYLEELCKPSERTSTVDK